MAVKYKWFPSPSYTNNSHRVDALILHTTEGATTNDAIKNYLCGPNGVSYHGSVDNQMIDVCYEYVYEDDKSWSCCNFNSSTLNYVFCTPNGASANWSRDYWLNNQRNAMQTMAHVIADQAKQWNVPIVALSSSEVQSGKRGIAQHMNLGSNGCGHSDCGPNFPMDKFIDLVKGGSSQPTSSDAERYAQMGMAITEDPTIVPVPPTAVKLYVGSDPGYLHTQTVKVRVAVRNKDSWAVSNLELTQATELMTVDVSGTRDLVNISSIDPKGSAVGIEWGF